MDSFRDPWSERECPEASMEDEEPRVPGEEEEFPEASDQIRVIWVDPKGPGVGGKVPTDCFADIGFPTVACADKEYPLVP